MMPFASSNLHSNCSSYPQSEIRNPKLLKASKVCHSERSEEPLKNRLVTQRMRRVNRSAMRSSSTARSHHARSEIPLPRLRDRDDNAFRLSDERQVRVQDEREIAG